MSYIQQQDSEERLNRYQRLKKESRNIVNHIAKLEAAFQSLNQDSPTQTEKDEVVNIRSVFINKVKIELGITP